MVFMLYDSPPPNIVDGVSLHDILQLPCSQLSADAHNYARHYSSNIMINKGIVTMLIKCGRD